MTLIKNINGTSGNKCKCGSWLKHWEEFSKKPAIFCSVKSCTEIFDLDGSHVQKATTDINWYIIPLCRTHNHTKGELEVSDETIFVSANKAITCEKLYK